MTMTNPPSNDGATSPAGDGEEGQQQGSPPAPAQLVSPERRTRVLLETLYHLITDTVARRNASREDQYQDTTAASLDDEGINRDNMLPLRILTEQDAESTGATCRFCFEGHQNYPTTSTNENHSESADSDDAASWTYQPMPPNSESTAVTADSAAATSYPPMLVNTSTTTPDGQIISQGTLVAPCACSGNSEWVHFGCLRRWQLHSGSDRTNQDRSSGLAHLMLRAQQAGGGGAGNRHPAAICNVCTVPFSLPPPRPPRFRSDALRRGTLLVHSADAGGAGGGTFDRTVILLLQGTHTTREDGIVEPAAASGVIINCILNGDQYPAFDNVSDRCNISWRRGGPVCGGRLGVLRYAIGHTLDITGTTSDDRRRLESESVYDGDGGPFRMVQERRDGSPAMFRASGELGSIISSLTQHDGNVSDAALSRNKIVLFGGYCKWSRGQLEQEVRRGLWKICNNGTSDDIVGSSSSVGRLWEDLNGRLMDRLVPFDDLFEEVN